MKRKMEKETAVKSMTQEKKERHERQEKKVKIKSKARKKAERNVGLIEIERNRN